MKKIDLKFVSVSIARALAAYGCFVLISFIMLICFKLEIAEQRYYLICGEMQPWEIAFYCALGVYLILFCVIYAFAKHNWLARARYLAEKPQEFRFLAELKNVVCSADFIAEAACFLLFTSIFAREYLFADIGNMFLPNGESVVKSLCVIATVMPVACISGILHRVFARRTWFCSRYSEEKSITSFIVKNIVYVAVIGVMFAFFWVYSPVLQKNFPVFLMVAQIILPFIVVPVVFLALVRYVSAVRARSAFIARLKKTCKAENAALLNMKNRFSFIFIRNKGANFILEHGGKKYACKFISSLQKGVSIILDGEGGGLYVHTFSVAGAVLGQWHTRFKYGFESDAEKVLIVCPRPQNMRAVDGGRLRDIDSGDRVGDAKLFSAEGFLRAIELDNLDM